MPQSLIRSPYLPPLAVVINAKPYSKAFDAFGPPYNEIPNPVPPVYASPNAPALAEPIVVLPFNNDVPLTAKFYVGVLVKQIPTCVLSA